MSARDALDRVQKKFMLVAVELPPDVTQVEIYHPLSVVLEPRTNSGLSAGKRMELPARHPAVPEVLEAIAMLMQAGVVSIGFEIHQPPPPMAAVQPKGKV